MTRRSGGIRTQDFFPGDAGTTSGNQVMGEIPLAHPTSGMPVSGSWIAFKRAGNIAAAPSPVVETMRRRVLTARHRRLE
jgi:hypothetical protein